MQRRALEIQGVVQGVGFRPFVYSLAKRLGLAGFVKNAAGTVVLEIEGDLASLDHFQTELATNPPPLARIDQIRAQQRPVVGSADFVILPSEGTATGPIFVSPDVATCDNCLQELFDPADRRYRYPFLNCTNCGPRLTIITAAPYDRANTTMAAFALCADCQTEYDDPENRRFHAQPTCCPACGPRLTLLDEQGRPVPSADPVLEVAAALGAGKIVALKGLGGYHLACNATAPDAVAELRRRKHRDEKPFALMVADVAAAEGFCAIEPAERELLLSPRRPIVLLRKHPGEVVAAAVAPNNSCLGVMLPYTPLHHLLLREMNGTPLVMTSGNRADEPIAYEDDAAVRCLAGIADLFLVHNRPIHVRCDDSVTRVVAGGELPLRRSRGYAPLPLALPFSCPISILAVGGQLKGTFALGHDRQAFLSHHLGDLDHWAAFQAFLKEVKLYEDLFALRPQVIAHDLHPDYPTTRYAVDRARPGVVLQAVQHHHAHLASCMAENRLTEEVIGVTFDGTGYGTDGAIWGGEFLVGDYRQFRRAAHLRYVGMPGGEQAIREPWRMALAHLVDAGLSDVVLQGRVPPAALALCRAMLERRLNTPPTSSMGRLFDAVAALAGVRDRVTYEGQAAVELERLAESAVADGVYPFVCSAAETPLVIDTRPMIRAVAEDVAQGRPAADIGRRFHATVVEMTATVCAHIRRTAGLQAVVLSGGVFMNVLLTRAVTQRLERDGFRVYRHCQVPPNDGGLSLGQLAIAAHAG